MTTETTNRIPASLAEQAIFAEFFAKILEAYDEITAYNEKVLGNKDSEWNSYKLLDKARELARPASGDANNEILEALKAYEALVTEVNKAKQAVVSTTAKELGIDYAVGNERDTEVEAPLKEKRAIAINIGNQLIQLASMTNNQQATDIKNFLAEYDMPFVGRNQATAFTAEPVTGAPKYRVKVVVSKNDEVVAEADGFTKASQAVGKFYDAGKKMTAETLRTVWEKEGNSIKETPVPTVEFVDETVGLVYTITKKN